MSKIIHNQTKSLSIFQTVLFASVIYLLLYVINKSIPHKIFPLPSTQITFEKTATLPSKFSVCATFQTPLTRWIPGSLPQTCIEDIAINPDGSATLPESITTRIRLARINSLNITALGVRNDLPCLYHFSILPDPWKSGIGGDLYSAGFSEINGKTITLTCNPDIVVSSVKALRTPPANPNP